MKDTSTIRVSIAHDQPLVWMQATLIGKLAAIWEQRGIQTIFADHFRSEADIGILHLDRTVIETRDIPPVPAGLKVMNLTIRDISKRRYSSLIIGQDSDWDGPVIIKTDLNHFGLREREGKKPGWLMRRRLRLAQTDWKRARLLPDRTYPVLESVREVPGWVWRDKSYIVERFIPERENGQYVLRGAVFFGKRHYAYRVFSPDHMVKTGTMTGHEFLTEAPPEVQAFRQANGFDFAKIDYVEHEGRPVILDANKTPTIDSRPDSPRLLHLADGLAELLP